MEAKVSRKKRKKNDYHFYSFLLIWLIIFLTGTIFLVSLYSEQQITGLAILNLANASDFNQGTYLNTSLDEWGRLHLTPEAKGGSYTSKIFNAGAIAHWNNLSIVSNGFGELPPNQKNEHLGVNMSGNVLLLHLNDDSSNRINDSSGFNHQGKITNVTYVPGFLKEGMRFETSQLKNLTVPYSSSLFLNQSGSVEAWVNFASLPNGTHTLALYASPKYPNGWLINQFGTSLYIYLGSKGQPTLNLGKSLSPYVNQWIHIVITWNQTTHNAYLNGIKTATALRGPSPMNPEGTIYFGGSTAADTLNATLDEVSLYNRTLSAIEIREHYQRGLRRLDLYARSCKDALCDDEPFTFINNPAVLSLWDNPYFQYHFALQTINPSLSNPLIYNISLDYTILNTEPELSLISPLVGEFISSKNVTLTALAIDKELNPLAFKFYGDGQLQGVMQNQSSNTAVSFLWPSPGEGNHTWYVEVNDGVAAVVSANSSFILDSIAPEIKVIAPISGKTYRIHSEESSIPLFFTANDIHLDVCKVMLPEDKEQIIHWCKNTSFILPSFGIDTELNVAIIANDSAGNTNRTNIAFNVDYSQGSIKEVEFKAPEQVLKDTIFIINSSAECKQDWCEDISAGIFFDTTGCSVLSSSLLFEYGDLEESTIVTPTWKVGCTHSGNYQARVKYSIGSKTITESSLNVSVSSAEKQVYSSLSVGKQYLPGHNVSVTLLLQDAQGKPVSGSKITIDIYDPNWNNFLTSEMAELTAGTYKISFPLPSDSAVGDYFIYAHASEFTEASLFQVFSPDSALTEVNQSINSLLRSLDNSTQVMISDYPRIIAGNEYRIKILVLDHNGKPKSVPSVLITLLDPLQNIIVDKLSIKEIQSGVYEYRYLTDSSHTSGIWEASITINSSYSLPLSSFWELLGSPAQVTINKISDATLPDITADATITNEGNAEQEYRYEYCIVKEQFNPCGGKDDIDFSSGAKLLHPGESYYPLLTLTVPQAGEFYFKLLVYFGTEKSGSTKKFQAIVPPIASTTIPSGGTRSSNDKNSEMTSSFPTGGVVTSPLSFENQTKEPLVEKDLNYLISNMEKRISRIEKSIDKASLETNAEERQELNLLKEQLETIKSFADHGNVDEANSLLLTMATSLILLESDLIKNGLYQETTLLEQLSSPLVIATMVILFSLISFRLGMQMKKKKQN